MYLQIAASARLAASDLVKVLPRRAEKVKVLVKELSGLWENPAERLQNIASTDITLMDELNGVGKRCFSFLNLKLSIC